MPEEGVPLLVGWGSVLLAGTQRSAPCDERAMRLDRLAGVDGVVPHGRVDVGVPGDDLRDVRGKAAAAGVGDEDPPEVMGREIQGLSGRVGEVRGHQYFLERFAQELRGEAGALAAAAPLEEQWHLRVPGLLSHVIAGDVGDGTGARVANTGDDRAQYVGEFWADQDDSFLVGFGGRDLQEGDDLAGRGQPVLDQAVMAGLQHFLDADAGVLKKLDHGPGPECAAFREGQVDAPAGGHVHRPGRSVLRCSREGVAREGEMVAWWGVHQRQAALTSGARWRESIPG